MPFKPTYGPYRLSGGCHAEDVPSGVSFTVKLVEPSFVTDSTGKKWKVARTSFIVHDGAEHSAYREEPGDKFVKVTPSDLVEGDVVHLAQETIWGAPDVPRSLRKPHVKYEQFMSFSQLHKLNSPNDLKYVLDNDQLQLDEIAELKRQNEEMRRQLAERATQRDPAETNPGNKQQPQAQGKKQLQPA